MRILTFFVREHDIELILCVSAHYHEMRTYTSCWMTSVCYPSFWVRAHLHTTR